jgi:Zn-dependent protease with chaperone function
VTNILNKIIHALYIEKDKMNSASSKYTRWSHLDGLNWEVLVVDASYVHAYSHAGGKIVITVASICRHTDQQLATILVHEVCFFFF